MIAFVLILMQASARHFSIQLKDASVWTQHAVTTSVHVMPLALDDLHGIIPTSTI
ncbi:hypothetical protein FA10DRAFT_270056 [Acaromyces ingoldii]|uniref:Uncharacterized protein n=1 Tax=Acaromyces ingoldii TaxID=215250 RepID=A0A316YAL4_9BASI|nr:hypothetical protein FA10DRAFT_270056 [Acaromyces ingoldii]PWN86686.1 hypothetical protein FA10DRAFT_270056 [Acaromyces ingoldii]